MANLDFNALVIDNRRSDDDFVCSTVWAKEFGKEWKKYKESTRFKKLSTKLAAKLTVRNSDVAQTVRKGNTWETWVHPVIAIDFAEWLSTDFGIFVKEIFLRYLDGDAELGAEMIIRDHNKQRVERAKDRLLVCQTNKDTAELATRYGVSHGAMHNDRYRGLYDKTAAQLRDDAGIGKKDTPLDRMSQFDLSMNSLANQMALRVDDPNALYGFASDLKESFEKRSGKKLEPTWEKDLPINKARKLISNGQLELPV